MREISNSFDIMPKPENMALRLLTSVWLIAPISGAAVKYSTIKSTMPVASPTQSAAFKTLKNRYVAMAAIVEASNILVEA